MRNHPLSKIDKTSVEPTPSQSMHKFDKVRDAIGARHYSWRTEESYVGWILSNILFHREQHPRELGVTEVTEFLSQPAA